MLVPKANSKVRLCLTPAWLNQALIRPIHRGPKLNDILSRLNNVRYMSIIDASSRYHHLKLDKKSSYLTTFACQFGRYSYKHLLFGAVPVGDMSQHKMDKIFNDMPNMFGIADDILVVGYNANSRYLNETVHKVLQRCSEVNLKLNKDKCHFRCTSVPFFGEAISRNGVQLGPQKIKALMDMAPPNNKSELHAFLCIINYLGKFLQTQHLYVILLKS